MDAFQELTPIIYRKNGIHFLHLRYGANEIPITAHWHNRIELLYITSGSLEVYLNDVHYTAVSGETVIILPDTIHCASTGPNGAEYHVIAFDPEKFCNATIASDNYLLPLIQQKTWFYPITNHPEIENILKELICQRMRAPVIH